MKSSIAILLAVVALTAAGCATGESYFRVGYDFSQIDKVAVVDVFGGVTSDSARNQISDFFVMELLKKGYAPIERAHVQALLKEQEFQASEITSPKGVAKAGKILNVPTIIVVNIPKFSEEISITAKMVDVEDGSILWMGSGSGRTGRTLGTIVGVTAGAVAGAVVAGEGNEAAGAIAGGVLGGVAGQALSPQQARETQKIIKKLCQSLPLRLSNPK